MGSHSHWLQGLSSPLIKEADKGQKELKLRFDVSEYTPEEIMVKTVDNKLLVRDKIACHFHTHEQTQTMCTYICPSYALHAGSRQARGEGRGQVCVP